ncbi:MAG TPA: flavodoxin family protein [Smithellaceae bacterium]|nr:flavodoxin family protein [Smithellaceae bacterium]
MKILILNGNPDADRGTMDLYVSSLLKHLQAAGHDAGSITLRDKKIGYCVGCFNCWLKTPGICSIQDDAIDITRQYIASDHVILASPLIAGFMSSLLKSAMDRNICLVHPHLEEVDGEVHHKKRYDKYPLLSFLLEKEPTTDEEDIAIATDIFRRQAVNVWTSLGFVYFIETPVEEIIHAINIH